MNYKYQIGGGKCSLCGSANTNITTCPLNPNAARPNPMKHPLTVKGKVEQKINTVIPTPIPATIRPAIQVPTQIKIPEQSDIKPKVEMQYIDTPPFGCALGKIGRRDTMEDEHVTVIFDNGINLYGVFDGHGGTNTAVFLREELPKELYKALITSRINLNDKEAVKIAIVNTYANLDAQIFKKGGDSGSTAVVILQIYNTLYFINLGDSRAILVQEGKVVHATIDQKPKDEIDRITAAGGVVIFGRVAGVLAVARAFGDNDLKIDENGKYLGPNAPVSSVPVITTFDMNPNTTYIALLACDGLWDVMTNEEVAEQLPPVGQLTSVCKNLIDEAIEKGSRDNISVMITVFKAE